MTNTTRTMRDKHFEVLDGLRGTAAIGVFGFHMLELVFAPENNPLRHAALAVDFFFCLSGYVIGHAYDPRLALDASPGKRLTFSSFAARRAIRLHPLVVFGLLWGLTMFLCDPFTKGDQSFSRFGFKLVTENVVLGLLMLPAPTMLWGLTHSLNGPAWSLTQEYLANIVYGFWGNRAGKRTLFLIVIASALLLLKIALNNNTLVLGAAWENIWVAPVRVTTSFTLGLLLSRRNTRWKLPYRFPILSLALIVIMIMPTVPGWNGFIEWLMAVAIFPAIVVAGAGQTNVDGLWGPICRLSGRLSYPLYMLHYAFVLYFFHWYASQKPTLSEMWLGTVVTLLSGILFSLAVMKWFDEPIRAILARRLHRAISAEQEVINALNESLGQPQYHPTLKN